jgi:mevalonate pyrophosphate decarboxylase
MFLDDMSTSHRHTQIQEQVKKLQSWINGYKSQLTYVEKMKEILMDTFTEILQINNAFTIYF